MSEYVCNRCLRTFKRRDYLLKHYKRIYPCLIVITHSNDENKNKTNQKPTNNQPKTNQKPTNNQPVKNDFIWKCEYCNKQYSFSKSYYRHKNELRCKEMPLKEVNRLKSKLKNKKIQKELQLQLITPPPTNLNHMAAGAGATTHSISYINNGTIINNSNTTINTLSIKLNPFGEENISFLTKQDKLKILQKRYMAVPELIKIIHKHPENQNFFIHNINKDIMGFLNKDNMIEYDNYNNLCNKIVDKNIQRFDDLFNELENSINTKIKTRLKTVLEESNDGIINDKYIQDIKFHLLTISKKHKKEINNYLDELEKKIKSN
jgi:hypothetical protein